MENQNKISQQSQSSLHSALHDGKYSVSVSTEWSHLQIDCLSRLQVEVVKTLPKVIISFLIKDHTKPVFDLLKALKERNHSKVSTELCRLAVVSFATLLLLLCNNGFIDYF